MLDKTNWTAQENRVLLEPWRKVLLDAADLIEKRGHCKYVMRSRHGHICALAAITMAGGINSDVCNTMRNHIGSSISYWNDAPRRTAAEVIATMRKVATQ